MATSILNTTVSAFRNVENTAHPQDVNLLTWLQSDKYKGRIARVRSISDHKQRRALKAEILPGITPSCTCSYRNEKSVIKHSGLIQFDIDGKDNPGVIMPDLKQNLTRWNFIAYIAFSASGNGLWGLVHLQHPSKHKEHFAALALEFSQLGITLDPEPKNPVSFRYYSYDPEAYFNHSASKFNKMIQPKRVERPPVHPVRHTSNPDALEKLIDKAIASGKDMTQDRKEWVCLAWALINEFGEAGRSYFHALSRNYRTSEFSYDPKETDKQYDNCLRNPGKPDRSFIFNLAKRHDIYLKHH